jgi:hypothetical protein
MLLRGAWVVMARIRKEAARRDALLAVDDKIQEERQRIAERLVRELRKGVVVGGFGLAALRYAIEIITK